MSWHDVQSDASPAGMVSSSAAARRHAPALLIGEFDAMVGPLVRYASECFACDDDRSGNASSSSASRQHVGTRHLTLVDGDVVVGRHVATGALHRRAAARANMLAARVLTSCEAREQSVVFGDGDDGVAVGGVVCTLPDILARGEVRRFCLLFLYVHDNDDDDDDDDDAMSALVQRWPLFAAAAHVLIATWTATLDERRRREYNTIADLEHAREHARQRPLRSLMTLLADDNDNDEGDGRGDDSSDNDMRAQVRVHALLDSLLPLLFGCAASYAPHLLRTHLASVPAQPPYEHDDDDDVTHDNEKGDKDHRTAAQQQPSSSCCCCTSACALSDDRARALVAALQQLLRERVPHALQWVVHANTTVTDARDDSKDDGNDDDGGGTLTVLPQPSARTHVLPRHVHQLPTRPLAAWLVDCLCASPQRDTDTHAAVASLHTLLFALFSGQQVVVVAADASASAHTCADVALALAAMLPRTLASYRVYADAYVMPYESRIVSFSNAYMNAHAHDTRARASSTSTTAATAGARASDAYEASIADGVVRVHVTSHRITAVYSDDDDDDDDKTQQQLPSLAQQQSSPRRRDGRDAATTRPHTTLTKRMLTLVQTTACAIDGDRSARDASCRGLDVQLRQLVHEYVLRGAVYRALYREQEVRANRDVLHASDGDNNAGRAAAAGRRRRATTTVAHGLVTRALQRLGALALHTCTQLRSDGGGTPLLTCSRDSARVHDGASGGGDTAAAAAAVAATPTRGSHTLSSSSCALHKHAVLRVASSKAYMRDRYVFSSVAADDHDVLMFLGCAGSAASS